MQHCFTISFTCSWPQLQHSLLCFLLVCHIFLSPDSFKYCFRKNMHCLTMVLVVHVYKNKKWDIELLWCFLTKNTMSAIFLGRKKPLEKWVNDYEKQALLILVLLELIYNHCLTVFVVVLIVQKENVTLNFVMFLGSNTQMLFFQYSFDTKGFKKLNKWQWETSIPYASIACQNLYIIIL